MKSMTGYGYGEIRDEKSLMSVEIKGYNNRFLDVSVNLPLFLSSLEGHIRDYVRSRCERGRIDVFIRIKEYDAGTTVHVNKRAAKAYHAALENLLSSLNIRGKIKLSHILGLEGVLITDTERDIERYWRILEPALVTATDLFDAGRGREGLHTLADILSHIKTIEESAARVMACGPALENTIKENLRARFTELLGSGIDENRILAETAVLLVKYSISEELSRLSGHLKEFRAEVETNPAPGKKLDFLSQEISREINTLGSKSPVYDVSREVVLMKEALENIREQLRNIE